MEVKNEASGTTEAGATGNLGFAALRHGKLDQAHGLLIEALQLFRDIDDVDSEAETLERLAMLAAVLGEDEPAARLFARAAAARSEAGTLAPPLEHREVERLMGEVRDRLDPSRFDAAWEAGRSLDADGALALVRTLGVPPRRAATGLPPTGDGA